MTRPIASPLVRAAVMVLVPAVVLCLVLPMMGSGDQAMHFALVCCFVLAVALSVFVLRGPAARLELSDGFSHRAPLARGPTRTARAPDVFALGSLLI